jgi:transposase-like protein
MPRESPYSIQLTSAEKLQLESLARKYTSPYNAVVRAKMVLLASQGLPNDQIAASLSVPRQIVSKWRKRFFEERLAGLDDQPRTGRPLLFPPRSRRAGQGAGL